MALRKRFEKTSECPTNESLLAYQRDTQQGQPAITAHIAECEFCSMLLELLKAHPDTFPPAPDPPPMPEGLRSRLLKQLRNLNRYQ